MGMATTMVQCVYCRNRFTVPGGSALVAPRHRRNIDPPGVECPGSKQSAYYVAPAVAPRTPATNERRLERMMTNRDINERELL